MKDNTATIGVIAEIFELLHLCVIEAVSHELDSGAVLDAQVRLAEIAASWGGTVPFALDYEVSDWKLAFEGRITLSKNDA